MVVEKIVCAGTDTCGTMGGVRDRFCRPSQLNPSNHLCFWTA